MIKDEGAPRYKPKTYYLKLYKSKLKKNFMDCVI